MVMLVQREHMRSKVIASNVKLGDVSYFQILFKWNSTPVIIFFIFINRELTGVIVLLYNHTDGNVAGAKSELEGCGNECAIGKYGVAAGKNSESDACSTCLAGNYCPGNNGSIIACPGGRYGYNSGEDSEESACDQKCTRGRYGNSTGQSSESNACSNSCPA